jgi:hypothetical protein
MAYTPNTPLATDSFSSTQGPINANFQGIKTLVEIDHEAFDTADQGKHKQVTLPESAASPTTLADELGLFSRLSTLSAQSELAFRREGNGDVIEFTSALEANDGWTRLPSGILLKWGTGTGKGEVEITYPTAATIPIFAQVFSIQLTPLWAVTGDKDFAVRLLQTTAIDKFKCYISKRTTVGALTAFNGNLRYLAIGV